MYPLAQNFDLKQQVAKYIGNLENRLSPMIERILSAVTLIC